jgi:5-methylcytosine-specific restriction enzyme subunit McrC
MSGDTKFNNILTKRRFDADRLRSAYLCQLYAYLRTQEGRASVWDEAAGLLHPAIDMTLHEMVVMQGHAQHFATIDLSAPTVEIRRSLKTTIQASVSPADPLQPVPR